MNKLNDDLISLFKNKIRNDDKFAGQLWGALTNVTWTSNVRSTRFDVGLTFREAGAFIAEVRDNGETYINWYMSEEPGVVTKEIRDALASKGWSVILPTFRYTTTKTTTSVTMDLRSEVDG